VGQLAIRNSEAGAFRNVDVGGRPVAIVVSPNGSLAYVANQQSDAISVVTLAEPSSVKHIALGRSHNGSNENDLPTALEQQGERLFYDARLSLDGWFSCHSCHTDGHSNGRNADTFGDGSYGAPKRVLSLLGTGATGPWAWNASQKTLEDQVRQSLRFTLQRAGDPSQREVAALVAYLRTLEPVPPVSGFTVDPAAVDRGGKMFSRLRCAECHTPPSYTSAGVYDIGLGEGKVGDNEFNPPSLRGIAHAAPYFHDGRAKTLEAVFKELRHKIPPDLADSELNELIAFLRSL
jgi:cytochrome c peroxidase